MLSLTLKSIRAKKARFLLTAIAVTLGVAFMAGTLVLTDTIRAAYDEIAGNVYEGTDAVVRSERSVSEGEGKEVRGTVDAGVLEAVRGTEGVAAAEPQLLGIALLVADDGELLDANRNGSPPIALAWQASPETNPLDLVSGEGPNAPDEIVVDAASARAGGFGPGTEVRVLTKAGSDVYRVSGIGVYGGSADSGGYQVVAFAPETASRVLGEPGRFDAIQVVAASGVSETELVANLRATLGDGETEVLSGTDAVAEARTQAGAAMSFMNTFLLTFAIVALLVGSFVIYNTFSITVAQRTRETALLRAVGARRAQVLRSVVLESVLTGAVASAAGLVLGIGTAQGLRALLGAFGLDIPSHALVIEPRTAIVSLVVGTVVTVAAAYVPARKAAKVAPIAAMTGAALDRSARSVRRAVVGTVVTLAGAAFLAMGLGSGDVGAVGLGALGVFFGVTVLGPSIARPIARVLGAPLPRLRGMTGTLARENAMRNPRRSAATASALMIGVGLVVFITVLGASVRTSMSASIDTAMRADWIVETAWGMGGLSPDATQRIDALPETGAVTALRFATATVDGSTQDLSAFDPVHVETNLDLDVQSGALDVLADDEIAVHADEAASKGLALGDVVTLVFPETGEQRFSVGAVYETKEPLGSYSVSIDAYDVHVADSVDRYVMVSGAAGVPADTARTAIERVLDEYPNANLLTRDEFKGVIAAEIDQLLNLVYVLLFLAILIAFFGIANTLALSIFERTRELGLLRAVGMVRGQVRAAVRWESVLVALLGTTLGTAIGLGFAWALQQTFADEGIEQLAVPVGQLGAVVVVAAAAAVVAAALPARRAARLDVLDALHRG